MLTPERQQANAEREIYLAEVTHHLKVRLSPLEVYESVTELRDHIDAMVAAHEELGMDVELAMKQSLSKFGDAGRLGESIGHASSHTKSPLRVAGVRSVLPATFLRTLAVAWFSAFALLNLCDFLFYVSFPGGPLGLPLSCTVSFVVADIVTLLAVFVRHKRSLAFAGWITGAFNMFMGLTLYQTYLNLGRSSDFVLIASTLSVSIYTVAVIASKAASHFKGGSPSTGIRAI